MRLASVPEVSGMPLCAEGGDSGGGVSHEKNNRGTCWGPPEVTGSIASSRTRKVAEIATFATLYTVLTWIFAPISYQVFQFRIAEALKSIVVKRRHLVWAFVLGNALSNLLSPFVGPWELLWMPFINLAGAYSAWFVGQKLPRLKGMATGGAVYAIWVAFGVSFMLHMLFGLPLLPLFAYIALPELTLVVGFSPLMKRVNERVTAVFG